MTVGRGKAVLVVLKSAAGQINVPSVGSLGANGLSL